MHPVPTVDEYVDAIMAARPQLSDDQKRRLAALLRQRPLRRSA